MNHQFFDSAKPVWAKGRNREMNTHVGFRAVFEAAAGWSATLACATSGYYRVWLNGRFVGYGPARTARDFFRVDVWDLRGLLQTGPNLVAIEAVGYNVNSYAAVDQPSFLQAEVKAQGHVLASTAGAGVPFRGVVLNERVQRVQRYSFQRPFIEVYRLGPGYDLWRRDLECEPAEAELETADAKRLLPRGAPLPRCEFRMPLAIVARGRAVEKQADDIRPWRDRSLTGIGPGLAGFAQDDLALTVSDDMGAWADADVAWLDDEDDGDPDLGFSLARDTWAALDFGANQTGFIGVQVRCREPIRLQALFDELLTDGRLDFLRLNAVNVATWFLAPGDYVFETIEPYTLRYLKLLCLEGTCEIESVFLRELACPDADSASFLCSDPELEEIFEAGRETFRQNAVDIFMDCPSRERAGWLCDSFFTGRVEKVLRGANTIERDFLENFLLPDRFETLPEGMLPMCYPADHPNGRFIPNWPLWLVLELEEYRERGGDPALVAAFRDKVMALFRCLDAYVNDDGLLENVPSWVFVEWSKANDFVQDVNYPTNMLWAAALDTAGRLYGDASLRERAETVRRTIRDQAYDGAFFVDNAIREKDGQLVRASNRTETCQYYAFWFHTAKAEDYPELWNRLLTAFGPQRKKPDPFAGIHPSNMLIGNCLRLELLARAGLSAQIRSELKAFFLKMARTTGTLWENNEPTASCNHAFASHAVCWLYRDILGCRVDECDKTVRLTLNDTGLDHAFGVMPLAGGAVRVHWTRERDRIVCRAQVPPGYRIESDNRTGLKLELSE